MKRQFFKAAVCALIVMICMAPAVSAAIVEDSELDIVNLPIGPSSTKESNGSKKYPFSKIKSRVAKYKEVNKDVIGWLTVPETNINMPVVHSTKSNDYYVKRDWQGNNYPDLTYANWNKKPATAEYLDYRAKIGETWKKGTSRNLVIYGHNWTNLREPLDIGNVQKHVMFAQLKSYTNIDFAKNNPYIYFSTGSQEGIWKVFSVAYCELSRNFAYNSPNPSKDEFNKLISEWKLRSLHNFDTEVNESDRLLTLSTCTRQYNMGDYQRFVVVARLLRDGESEKDKVKIAANTNIKPPQF